MSQRVIDILQFLWTTFHDFVYLGAYATLTHFHILSHKKSADERLDALEKAVFKEE